MPIVALRALRSSTKYVLQTLTRVASNIATASVFRYLCIYSIIIEQLLNETGDEVYV